MDNLTPSPNLNQPQKPVMPPSPPPFAPSLGVSKMVPQMPPKPLSSIPQVPQMPPRPLPPPPPLPPINIPKPSMLVEKFAPAMPPKPFTPAPPKVPPPVSPSATLRSLSSDIFTLKESGGISPKPQIIKLEESENNAPIFRPETANQLPAGEVQMQSRAKSVMVWAVIGIAVVAGFGLLGYYVVYPLIFKVPAAPVEVVSQPEEAPMPKVSHQSFFKIPATSSLAINLFEVSTAEIVPAISAEAQVPSDPGVVKELVFGTAKGQVSFGEFIEALTPNLSHSDIAQVAESDFTGFIYYNSKGVWPGYIGKLKSGTAPIDAQIVFGKLESADIAHFYVTNPGSHSEFKTGPVKGTPVRYTSFEKLGASFNYGIVGDYIVISTSFDGFKIALSLLGL